MKNTLVIICMLASMIARAQESWRIPDYKLKTTLFLNSDRHRLDVIRGDSSRSFSLDSAAGKWTISQEGAVALLNFTGLDAARINSKYSGFGQDYNAAEKLIKRVSELQGRTMIIEGLEAGAPGGEEVGGVQENPAEPATAAEGKPAGGIAWFWIIPALLVGAGIGYALRKQPAAEPVAEPIKEPAPEPELHLPSQTGKSAKAESIMQLRAEIKELQATNKTLTRQTEETATQLKEIKNFDNRYFDEAYKKLVSIQQEALEKGDRTAFLENALKMAAQFEAVTRYKLSRKLDHDLSNLSWLADGRPDPRYNNREINGNTAPDSIPGPVKLVADLLKSAGSRGLDETIFSGYKIKDL